jgi:hypothetical protein
MPLSPDERSLRSRLAAHSSWAQCADRSGRTAPARRALQARFEHDVDPNNELPLFERARRAEHLRKAYYAKLALKSAAVRRSRSAGRRADEPGPMQ